MLKTLPQTRDWSLAYRLGSIAAFTALTAVGARVTVEIGPVPLTLQTLAVFLAGMTLGAKDGAWSQILYVGLIAVGLPLDARGLGAGVFAGPTWGYLLGFILCAYVTGYITERAGHRWWLRVFAALIGSLFVFIPGVIVLQAMTQMPWREAFESGFLLFSPENLAKAGLAAGIAEGTRALLLRAAPQTERGV
ncbi:MAG: biotin transporter BioY [bacterium]|nr:biotin transporter BioY [bacterium]